MLSVGAELGQPTAGGENGANVGSNSRLRSSVVRVHGVISSHLVDAIYIYSLNLGLLIQRLELLVVNIVQYKVTSECAY